MSDHYTVPLSMPQQEIFFNCVRDVSLNLSYNLSIVVELLGELDRNRLQQALDVVVARHEALRIVGFSRDGKLQEIARRRRVMIEEVVPDQGEVGEDGLTRLLNKYMAIPFALEGRCGFFSCRLISCSPQRFVLHLLVHHLTVDGIGMGIILSELAAIYSALKDGRDWKLEEAPCFRRHVEAERSFIESPEAELDFNYWNARVGSRSSFLSLVGEFPSRCNSAIAGQVSITLNESEQTRLEAAATEEGVTFFVLMQSAFQLFVSRWCGEEGACLGVHISTRGSDEAQLVGHCVSLLPVPTEVAQNRSFREILSAVRGSMCDAIDHCRVTFSSLRQRFPKSFGRAGKGLAVMFNIDPFVPEPNFAGLQSSARTWYPGYSAFELDLNISLLSRGSRWDLLHSRSLMGAETAKRFLRFFADFTRELCLAPSVPTISHSIVPAAERDTIAREYPVGRSGEFRRQSVLADLEYFVQLHPTKLAVAYKNRGMAYAEMWQCARRAAALLVERGIQRGDKVAIALPHSIDAVVWVLAVLYVGGVVVPIDIDLLEPWLKDILEDERPRVLVGGVRSLSCEQSIQAISFEDFYSHVEAPSLVPYAAEPDDCACIHFSRRSTGRPKGVMVSYGNLRYAIDACRLSYDLNENDVHLHMVQFSLNDFVADLLRSLCCGGTLVIWRADTPIDPLALYAVLDEQRVTFAEFGHAVFRILAAYLISAGKQLDYLRTILISSDFWSVDEYRVFKQLCRPEVRLVSALKVTEAMIDIAHYQERYFDLPSSGCMPLGRPNFNTFLYVVDEQLVPLPPGVPGKLCVGGAALAQGYLDDPKLTWERRVEDTFPLPGTHLHLYPTGDRAYRLNDGNIVLLGHSDSQATLAGVRLNLEEIEDVLRLHPLVVDALAAVEHDGNSLIAYVVLSECAPTLVADLRMALADRLPYYMVPTIFRRITAIPLTADGKRDRASLSVLPAESLDLPVVSISPVSKTERRLLELWQEHFGSLRCGVLNDFYEWGGSVFAAVTLRSKVEQCFGRPLPLSALLHGGTIRSIAAYIETSSPLLSSVVPMALNHVSGGNPIYFLHGAEIYQDIAAELSSVSAFSLYANSIQGKRVEVCSVEELGEYYAGLLRSFCKGHIFLCGFSEAGLIAFEAARCLAIQGVSSSLILLDTLVPRIESESIDIPVWGKYCPKPFNGRVSLFRAIEDYSVASSIIDRGWTAFCEGGITLHDFSSTHLDLLHMPIAGEVAQEIEHILKEHSWK